MPGTGQPPLQEELGAWRPRPTSSVPEDPEGEASEGTRNYVSTGQGAQRGGLQICTNKNRMSHECPSQFEKKGGMTGQPINHFCALALCFLGVGDVHEQGWKLPACSDRSTGALHFHFYKFI